MRGSRPAPLSIVYLNGEFLPRGEAAISPFDRGFLFGDGVYEVLPVLDGRLVDQAYCLERLASSLDGIRLDYPEDLHFLIKNLQALVHKNGIQEGLVYLQITRGPAARQFAFPDFPSPTCFACAESRSLLLNPMAEEGVGVVSVEDWRWKRRDIKSVNLLAQCLAKQQAVEAGAFEAWMFEDGYITEGASSSAFIIKGQTLQAPPLSRSILPGIRRRAISESLRDAGYKMVQAPFTREEAWAADEAFLCSATTFVLPVVSLDRRPIGDGRPGPVTRRIRENYIAHARRTLASP